MLKFICPKKGDVFLPDDGKNAATVEVTLEASPEVTVAASAEVTLAASAEIPAEAPVQVPAGKKSQIPAGKKSQFPVGTKFGSNPPPVITVNGIKAAYEDGVYKAKVDICGYRNEIIAECADTREKAATVAYVFPKVRNVYYLGVDDVILCFENIYKHKDEYGSLFDDPFLSVFFRLHEKYGTKTHMHIYYETTDGKFDLSMFPDKYKEEFIANSDWLRFTFHADRDEPAHPYKKNSYDKVMREGTRVRNEIERFAGAEVTDRATSQHWADSDIHGTRAFRDLGYPVLDAYFLIDSHGKPAVSYYLDKDRTEHAHGRDFWVDDDEGIIFVRDDIIINETKLEEIDGYMDGLYEEECHSFMYLLIHEQYFYDSYPHYEPDYEKRLVKTVEWCLDHGYRSEFISDVVFE